MPRMATALLALLASVGGVSALPSPQGQQRPPPSTQLNEGGCAAISNPITSSRSLVASPEDCFTRVCGGNAASIGLQLQLINLPIGNNDNEFVCVCNPSLASGRLTSGDCGSCGRGSSAQCGQNPLSVFVYEPVAGASSSPSAASSSSTTSSSTSSSSTTSSTTTTTTTSTTTSSTTTTTSSSTTSTATQTSTTSRTTGAFVATTLTTTTRPATAFGTTPHASAAGSNSAPDANQPALSPLTLGAIGAGVLLATIAAVGFVLLRRRRDRAAKVERGPVSFDPARPGAAAHKPPATPSGGSPTSTTAPTLPVYAEPPQQAYWDPAAQQDAYQAYYAQQYAAYYQQWYAGYATQAPMQQGEEVPPMQQGGDVPAMQHGGDASPMQQTPAVPQEMRPVQNSDVPRG
ncbi:hypothetical protein HDU96_008405 [Phlyctochytrium bullatum]|nr:hypothetical protein HDU96_008405 [Phlyctochytrium bullatum]